MTEGLVMPTVRHTGSLFLRDVFLSVGFERVTLRGQAAKNSLVFDHLYDTHMGHFKRWIERFRLVVIPLRDPAMTALSWAKRSEDFGHFLEQWRNLIALSDHGPLYVPIDRPDRQDYLNKVAEAIGAELSTDWVPVNTFSGPLKASPPDVSDLYDWPVIGEFYSRATT